MLVFSQPLSGVVANTCPTLEDKDRAEEEVESLAQSPGGLWIPVFSHFSRKGASV